MGLLRSLSCLVIVLAVGCCKPKTVYITVPCPAPPVIARPALPMNALKPEDTIERERILLVATIQVLLGHCDQLEVLLDAYRDKKK